MMTQTLVKFSLVLLFTLGVAACGDDDPAPPKPEDRSCECQADNDGSCQHYGDEFVCVSGGCAQGMSMNGLCKPGEMGGTGGEIGETETLSP